MLVSNTLHHMTLSYGKQVNDKEKNIYSLVFCIDVFVADLVSCSIWWHIITVTIPDNITTTDKAFLYITGGDNHG